MKKYVDFIEKAGFEVNNIVDFNDLLKLKWKDERKVLANIEVRDLENNSELFEYVDYSFVGNTGRKVFIHPYKDIVGVKLNDNLLVCCKEGGFPDDAYVDFYMGTILSDGSNLAIVINVGLERDECIQVRVGEVKGFSSLDFFSVTYRYDKDHGFNLKSNVCKKKYGYLSVKKNFSSSMVYALNYEKGVYIERENCIGDNYWGLVLNFLNNVGVVANDCNIQEGIKMIGLVIDRKFESIFNSRNVDEQIGSLEWKKKMLLLEVERIDKQIMSLEKFSSDSLVKKRIKKE